MRNFTLPVVLFLLFTCSVSSTSASNIDEVRLVEAGTLFEIPVRINGAITLNFILDSGASDVQIPLDVFTTLIRADTIEKTDLKGEEEYFQADGTKHKTLRFLIRELKIGNHTLRNVIGSVGSTGAPLLLGQSFLSNFDSWTLDNKRHVLNLVGKTTESEVASSDSHTSTAVASSDSHASTAIVCGKSVEFIEGTGDTEFVGVWTGNWNNRAALCSGLIVENIDPDGAANVIYVYGPGPGSRLSWKQQHRAGVLSGGVLSFEDDQGSTFRFNSGIPQKLDATFVGGSGHLTGMFEKSH